MVDSVVLKFLYKGKETEVFVDDVDLVDLFDMRAILYEGLDPLSFVHEWYSVQK